MDIMPMWCPPTPPQDNNDIYIDYSLTFMYDTICIPHSDLPPVFIRKDCKRSRSEAGFHMDGIRRPIKMRREENITAPRSLFDRPSAVMARIRRDLKNQRFRGVFKPNVQIPGLRPTLPARPPTEFEYSSDWNIFEDIAILHVLVNLQGLPCNLMILSPGHTPNWDLVAEIVNHCAKTYRSPKQCRWRYETAIQPREEGKLVESPKKHKKLKSNIKCEYFKGALRYLRTSTLYANDGNGYFTKMMRGRFDTIKAAYLKKAPAPKRQYSVTSLMNPKHMEVLQEFGVSNYDQPISPVDIAVTKANKIREKQRGQIQLYGNVQPVTNNVVGTTVHQQQMHELIANLNQQQPNQSISLNLPMRQQQQQLQQIQSVAQHSQSNSAGTAIILQQGNPNQQPQLMRSVSNSVGTNIPTQIVKAIVASSNNAALQHLTQQQLQQTVAVSAPVSVVLSSNVQTITASCQQQTVPVSSTQIMSIATPSTLLSNTHALSSGNIVQNTLAHAVSVSQLATAGTVITTSTCPTVTTLNTSGLRGQRIVTAPASALQDIVLHQRHGNANQTIVSMSSIAQHVTPTNFPTTQLRLSSIGSGAQQQVVSKSIPVSSLQPNAKLSSTGVTTGQQPAQIHLYRHRQQLKVLQSNLAAGTAAICQSQIGQSQMSGGQATLVNTSAGTIIQGNLLQGNANANIQLQGQKVSVANLSAALNTSTGTSGQSSVGSVQVTSQQPRTQLIKHVASGSKQTISRQINEADMLLVKRQMVTGHPKCQILQHGQIFNANASTGGVQLHHGSTAGVPQTIQQITAVVKSSSGHLVSGAVSPATSSLAQTVSGAGGGNTAQLSSLSQMKSNQIKVTMANQAQMRQLQMQQQQHLGAARKINRMTQIAATVSSTILSGQNNTATVISPALQLTSTSCLTAGVPAITQSKTQNNATNSSNTNVQAQLVHIQNSKSLPNSVTVQQIQQVMRQNQTGGLAATGLVFGKTSVGRVMPVSVASQTNQRQTFQVVSAASSQGITNSNMRANIAASHISSNKISTPTTVSDDSNNSGSGFSGVGSLVNSPQQPLISAIQYQAALQQNQRRNASPVQFQAIGGNNLVAVVQQQTQLSQNLISSDQSNILTSTGTLPTSSESLAVSTHIAAGAVASGHQKSQQSTNTATGSSPLSP